MLIDFIDGAYEGWVLLYKLRRHSFAVKARLNRIKGIPVKPNMFASMFSSVRHILTFQHFRKQPKALQEPLFDAVIKETKELNKYRHLQKSINQQRANNTALDPYSRIKPLGRYTKTGTDCIKDMYGTAVG